MDFRDYLNKLEDISSDYEPQVDDIVEIEMGDTLVETYIEDITEDGVIIKVDETALRLMIDGKKQLNEWMKMGADSDASASGSFLQGESIEEGKPGLWANIHAKRNRIKHGSGEKMRKPGSKGAPSAQDFKDAAKEDVGSELSEGSYKQRMHDDAEKMSLEQFLDNWCHRAEDKEWVEQFWRNINDEPDEDVDEAKYQGREVPLGKPMAGDVKKSKVYVKGPKGNVVKVNFGDKNMRIKKSNPGRRKNFRARHNCDNPGPRWKARYWSCRAW